MLKATDRNRNHKNDPNSPSFVGAYVDDLRFVALVSAVAGVNASFQSPPGWGKTAILSRIGEAIAGADAFHRIDLSPSSSPAKFEGTDDPQELINSGRFVRVYDDTPYDPNLKIVVADELFRASKPTFDAALHAIDPEKQSHSIVWATNNFVASGERVEALLDRIALFYWFPGEELNVRDLVRAQAASNGSPTVPGFLPNWDDVEEIRAVELTPRAIDAVAETIEELIVEASQEGFNVGHPRQIAQWTKIVSRMSVFATGTGDFDKVPDEALRALRYAYGAKSYDEARRWTTTVTQIVDRVQAEIDRILAENVVAFREVAKIDDPTKRNAAAIELGSRLAAAQATLATQFGNEPRVVETIQTLSNWHSAAILGNIDRIRRPA